MGRFLFVIFIAVTLINTSCKDNVICPAFQSTYILNDSIRRANFSLFGPDSLPKYMVASRRNKFGINKQTSLFRKNYELKTAPKVNVLGPPKKDSLYAIEEGEFYASDFADSDSLSSDSTDSTSVELPGSLIVEQESSGPQYKYRYDPKVPYNHEQEYYNKYYGELFIDNRPPPEDDILESFENSLEQDSTEVKPKKRFGGLFKRKQNEEEAEPEIESEIEEIDPETEEGEDDGGND